MAPAGKAGAGSAGAETPASSVRRSTPGVRPRPAHPAHHHVVRLVGEYLRLRYVGRYLKFLEHMRTLPRLEARVAFLLLGLVGIVIVAMPALVWLRVHLAAVTFQPV